MLCDLLPPCIIEYLIICGIVFNILIIFIILYLLTLK